MITISLFKTKIEKQVRDPNLESLPPHQENHLKLSTDKDKGKFNKLEEISHATKISDKTHQEKSPLQRFYKRTKPNSLEGSKS